VPLTERLRLARTTYHAAVTRARVANTPHTWRRLVRAGANLREVEARRRVQARDPRRGSVLLVEDLPAVRGALLDLISERPGAWTAPDDRTAPRRLHRVKTPP